MNARKVWFITGAGRGLGVDIVKAALAAGHAVVATGRARRKVAAAIGNHDDLLILELDVTRPQDAHAAIEAKALLEQSAAHRDLSSSLAHDNP